MACITKRRDRWVIDFYDQYGKRRWKTLPEGTTKKKARDELRAIEEQVARRSYLPCKKVPIFSEVAKEWLEHKRPKIRASTWGGYERQVKIHFKEFNDLKANRITVATVEKFITKREEQGININTLRRILVTLNQIMNYAVRHKYIDHNPVREAERPKGRGNGAQSRLKILIPSRISALLEAEKDMKYKTLFTLAVFSGARQGELLGLRWRDIDWENSQIHIKRTFNYGRFYEPKSDTSRRAIDLGPKTMRQLKEWKLACQKNEFDLVFPNGAGKPIDHHQMIPRHFQPALKKANLPKIRFHDLRHTYASLLIQQGENIKYIQNQLGHSSPTVTLNVYAHLMKSTNQEAACRLENTVFKESSSKMVAETERGGQVNEMTGE